MAKDLIRYDILTLEALRNVVRLVLKEVAKAGLPGEHHMYITFRSYAPGVNISERLQGQYPEDMTIVLQHQFWDLEVNDSGFEVGLAFAGVPEKLVVPFSAIIGFYDPFAQFGLQFDIPKSSAQVRPPSGDISLANSKEGAHNAVQNGQDDNAKSMSTDQSKMETIQMPEDCKVISIESFRRKS